MTPDTSEAATNMADRNNVGNTANTAAAVDPALLAAIQAVVQTSMQGMMQAMRSMPAANQEAGAADPQRGSRLRVEDLGFFDPSYESEANEPIVNVGRHVYYRNIFVWVDHLKELAKDHGDQKVRSLLT